MTLQDAVDGVAWDRDDARRLNPAAEPSIRATQQELSMLALYIILGFVAVVGAFNLIEFGRVD